MFDFPDVDIWYRLVGVYNYEYRDPHIAEPSHQKF